MTDNAMQARAFWGKYRGKVTDNNDPLKLGRVQATVPTVMAAPLNWATPCTPYAGPQEGFYMIPPVGANIWIEFEGGDPNYPIWSGGFWGETEKQKPPTDATGPTMKVLQSEKFVLSLDDKNNKLTLKRKDKADMGQGETMSLTMDDKQIVLTAKKVTITITPEKIELKQGNAVIELRDQITLKLPPATVEVSKSITLKNGGTSTELSTSAVTLKNGGASVAMSPASVNINNGALEIT